MDRGKEEGAFLIVVRLCVGYLRSSGMVWYGMVA